MDEELAAQEGISIHQIRTTMHGGLGNPVLEDSSSQGLGDSWEERGPRYVNNVAVFVKKGQKDIDANEHLGHVSASGFLMPRVVSAIHAPNFMQRHRAEVLVKKDVLCSVSAPSFHCGLLPCPGKREGQKSQGERR